MDTFNGDNFKNLIQNFLIFFPSIALMAIILKKYISDKYSADKHNPYLLTGLIVSIITVIPELYFYSFTINTGTGVQKYVYPLLNVLGSFSYKLIIYGIIVYLFKFEILKNDIQKENIFLMILYSILTLGYYVPYWFIKKDMKFKGEMYFQIILLIFFLSCLHSGYGIFLTKSFYGSVIFKTIIYYLGSLGYSIMVLISLFSMRSLIQKRLNNIEIDTVATFFLGILYMQHKLNQYIERHEKIK